MTSKTVFVDPVVAPPGPSAPAGRYLLGVLALTLVLAALVVAGNRLADPFGFYRTAASGLEPPEFTRTLRTSKAMAVARLKPRSVILGTSRAELAISPAHPGWLAHPVYNMAISGGSLYEMRRFLQHAQAIQPLRQVVLTAELGSFLRAPVAESGFDEAALVVDAEGRPTPWGWRHHVQALFSWRALFSSVDLLVHPQRRPDYQTDGLRLETAKKQALRRTGGQYRAFTQREGKFVKNRYAAQELHPAALGEFGRLLDFALKHGISLRIALDPVHARRLELYDRLNRWEAFEAWKRWLTTAVAERRAAGADVAVWDFSGYNRVTTEPLPAPGDIRTLMKLHWELSHYRKTAGDQVLDILFGLEPPAVHDSFGVQLLPATLEAHLERIRQERASYRQRTDTVLPARPGAGKSGTGKGGKNGKGGKGSQGSPQKPGTTGAS